MDSKNQSNLLMNILLPLVPWLLIFGFVWFFVFRQLRDIAGAGGMLGSFGKSKHKITAKDHTNITFDDVAGIEEAKEEVMEIVEFLKNPKKFQRLGRQNSRAACCWWASRARGKTLLAKAIAGEADCPFFSISGSDFVEMFVGVGRQPRARPFQAGQGQQPRASSSWTKLTRSDAGAAVDFPAAGTTSASRRSTPSWSRWTASTRTTR